MRKLFVSVVVIALLVTARTASAATITFNVCDVASFCNQLQLTTTLSGSAIDVVVAPVSGNYGLFGDNGIHHAFAININGEGVEISNLTPGFVLDGSGKIKGETGNTVFDFLMNGSRGDEGATLPLEFRVTRHNGFLTDLDLFETSDGFYAAARLFDKTTGTEGHVAATDPSLSAAAVPEPATMVLLGTGLLAIFRKRKGHSHV